MDKLIEEQQCLQRFVVWMERREIDLGPVGLDMLDTARADLRAVNEKITEKECGA